MHMIRHELVAVYIYMYVRPVLSKPEEPRTSPERVARSQRSRRRRRRRRRVTRTESEEDVVGAEL